MKVDFINKVTKSKVTDIWNVVIDINPETSELNALWIGETSKDDVELEIRVQVPEPIVNPI